mmetsp:Transcript_53109/g.95275  ORF Transcript_53109/g.95275 Transcript_53109/m.95275 type:complete len:417 (-) Transcript_53109:103-1353(-)
MAAEVFKYVEIAASQLVATQAKLADMIVWVATLPWIKEWLEQMAEVGFMQDMSHAVLGHRKIPPASLLAILLALLGLVMLTFIIVPKAKLVVWGVIYFIVSGDKKPRKPDDIRLDKNSQTLKHMKIVFIRHGESQWNSVFNVGWKLFMPFRLVQALIREAFMVFERDSIFYDSPLNDKGLQQGWDLLSFLVSQPAGCRESGLTQKPVEDLQLEDIVSMIRGDVGESIVASSNLRRAISTGLLALSPRFLKSSVARDRVQMMTCLQEISRNVDTLSITSRKAVPKVPGSEASMKNMGELMTHFYKTRIDAKLNSGNKTLEMKANKRQEEFIEWVFDQKEVDCIIVAGHSLWFREFFKSYLPKSSTHVAKTAKMVNCGVVAFDLYSTKQHGTDVVRITPEGIKEIYGGFEVKGKKKKE